MPGVFVYGTLLQGESRGGIILAATPPKIVQARTPGRLIDLGEYPGLIPADGSGQWVFGEYAEFPALEPLLAQLDAIEEYVAGDEPGSLYLRRSVPVILEDETRSSAWAYLYNQPYDPHNLIKSGDWRLRRE